MSSDQRASDRFNIATDGLVVLQSGARVPFKVIDISQRGARIRLSKMMILSEKFRVDIISPDRMKVKRCDCVRQWQKTADVGLKFLTSETIQLDEPAL